MSVIVPIYNVEAYLRECLDSIVSQTHKDLDIILIDDGSTDGSGAICDEYAESDLRIRALHTANSGLSQARNVGIEAARGDWLTFVDSDDWIHVEFVERLLRGATDNGADVAVADFVKVASIHDLAKVDDGLVEWVSLDWREALREFLGPKNIRITVAWGKLYARAVWGDNLFPVGRYHEDEFTTHLVMGRCQRVALTDWSPYYYRQRSASIMAAPHPRRKADVLDAYRKRAYYFRSVGLMAEADVIMRRLFGEYIKVHNQARSAGEQELVNQLRVDSGRLAFQLIRENQSLPFRLFCAAYSIAPSAMAAVYRLYSAALLKRNRSTS